MRKDPVPPQKPKADRLLKQLPLGERKVQQQIRQQIMADPLFSGLKL